MCKYNGKVINKKCLAPGSELCWSEWLNDKMTFSSKKEIIKYLTYLVDNGYKYTIPTFLESGMTFLNFFEQKIINQEKYSEYLLIFNKIKLLK